MKARYITNGTYVDWYFCPECDEEMGIWPGQDEVECPNCERKWTMNWDYSFEDGMWRNCTTITPSKQNINKKETNAHITTERK